MSDTRVIKVDGEEVEVPSGLTLLQACEAAGKEIPRFCYHERLSIAGNCRMCLIEVKGGPPKPVASCAQNVRDLRPGPDGAPPELFTNTPMVKKAREGVMEFLLINHPLDCPICDQGGECDLQDQSLYFGRAGSRYDENKRAVEDKNMGPLVKTVMTRCIQCTRCVRFVTEVAGVDELGLLNRGEDAEITTYLEKSLTSELSGNVIDLCPVGALTSKPYAFNARPWELRKSETIDVMDAVGAHIRVDVRGREVLRIVPRVNEEINEEWISDKTRFVWDGLRRQRLDKPFIRNDGKLTEASWENALSLAAEKLSGAAPERVAALAGDLASAESMKALKDLMVSLGVKSLDCRMDGERLGGEGAPRESYLFNSTIEGVDNADAILLVGANLRKEAPLINARIRKNWLHNMNVRIGLIGERVDLTYDYDYLGAGPESLGELAVGGGAFFEALKSAKRPLIILGAGAVGREDGAAVLAAAAKLAQAVGAFQPASDEAPAWNGFSLLHSAAARVAGLDLGFLPQDGGDDARTSAEKARNGGLDVAYLLGADHEFVKDFKDAFVIYQGSHGDAGASVADIVFPAAAYTEEPGLFVNTEGRAQLAQRAAFPPGEARENWAILRALSDRLGKTLPYDSLEELRQKMIEETPVLASLDHAPGGQSVGEIDASAFGAAGELIAAPFHSPIEDFYLSNPIARASAVLAECSARNTPSEAAAAE